MTERLRVGPFREGTFRSALHSDRIAAILGIALGVTFTVCFLTGILSHLIQYPAQWFLWPSRPTGLYRITQGVHVATGIASVPLLLAKLWTVYPRFWRWPPLEGLAHALERLSLVPLVGGSLFLLVSGITSIARWHPYSFGFPVAHYWIAWVTMGGLLVHIGAKWSATRLALSSAGPAPAPPSEGRALTRRGFLTTVFSATGLLTVLTVGQTIRPLRSLSLLAPRDPAVGPQGFPVNRSARLAGVIPLATDPAYRLAVEGNVARPLSLSLEELRDLPQHEEILPIACVDGWSASPRWRGVRVVDLLHLAGAGEDAEVVVESLQAPGKAFRASTLNRLHARDPATLLALEVNGEPLHLDHGFPVRLIGPNRPGVMQTKWVGRLVVR
jgi:DMSO/TMAO reductase YedYZ molybdopterin-dependent catalytic subunit